MHVWVNAPQSLPVGSRIVRFAIGTPDGLSSNSWVVTTSKAGDIYIAGRDNFSESKISLHQSGSWRLAHTQKAAAERPDLLGPGEDRVVDKWSAPDGWKTEPTVAFRVVTLPPALYLSPEQRRGWKRSVVFVEPDPSPTVMTVVSVCVIPDGQDFDYRDARGGKIAILQLVEGVHVHVLASWAPAWQSGIEALGESILAQSPALPTKVLENGVALLHGRDDDGVRFLMPLPLSHWRESGGPI